MEKTLTSQAAIDLQNFKESVIETLAENERNQMEFFVGDLKVEDSKLKLDDNFLSKEATKTVLSHLRVKNNFLDLQKKMSEEDWESVSQKLKSINASQAVFGRKMNAESTIVDLKLAHKKAPNGGIQVPEVFDLVYDALISSSADDYSLSERYFDSEKGEISVTLKNLNTNIDVFDNEEDFWKTGKRIDWSNTGFSIAPFFERLVCTNGNVAKQYGFSTNISRSKYNVGKVKSILESQVSQASDLVTPMLLEATRHLNKHNVSVREFLQYRGLFNEEEHSNILEKYFDLSYLNKAYRCDIEDMPVIWKSTADTGKNAYDFFNDLTWIASHPKEIKLPEQERRTLQIKASDLLFRETLDLELLAPKVIFGTKK